MDPQLLALQTIGGFTVGALIGYAARKLTKWLLLALGLMLLPVFMLWQAGILNVNWEKVNVAVGRVVEWVGVNISSMGSVIASSGALGLAGAVGFAFGLSGGFRHSITTIRQQRRFVKRKKMIQSIH